MTSLTEEEKQLLAWLDKAPEGRAQLVCEPTLVATLRRLAHLEPRLVSDVYEGSDGCSTARITSAGRALISTGVGT